MNSPKISVITPSVRKDALELTTLSLKQQLFRDFEWILGTPFTPKLNLDGIDEYFWVEDDFKGEFWSLNRIYNKLFKKARGELIVSLQDSIYIPPFGLKKFWEGYKDKGEKALFSGVGDQYNQLDEYGKPVNKVWDDPRKTDKYGSFYECYPNDMEWNWAAFPRSAIFEIGGMDEKLDFLGFGGDQLQVCERWGEAGYNFWLDQTNESFTLRHGRPKDWDKNHVLFNGAYDKRKVELKGLGKWPTLDYLK